MNPNGFIQRALSDFPVYPSGAGIVSPNFTDVEILPIQGGGATKQQPGLIVSVMHAKEFENDRVRQLNATRRKTNRSDTVAILQNRNNN